MMDQYKKETAQIHASAALIEMTKAAVREEEKRIRKGQCGQIPVPVLQMGNADYAAYHRKRSLRRWAYPVTAAAAVVILVSVSMVMRGVRSGNTMSGAAEADMDMTATSEIAVEEEACAEMLIEMNDGVDDSVVSDVEKMESAEGVMADSAEALDEAGSTGEAMVEAPAEDFAGDVLQSTEQETAMRESEKAKDQSEDSMTDTAGTSTEKSVKEFRSREIGSVEIDVVKEKPDFYDDPNVEDIVYESLTFRVVKEEKGWAAYVEVKTGEAYVIHGQIKDQEAFLQEAYARLTEEIG